MSRPAAAGAGASPFGLIHGQPGPGGISFRLPDPGLGGQAGGQRLGVAELPTQRQAGPELLAGGGQVAKTLFGKVHDDLARMEDILRDSGLDWTVLRPPQLIGKPLTGRYRAAYGRNVRGDRSVPRADVAHFMLVALDQPDTIGQVIGIAT